MGIRSAFSPMSKRQDPFQPNQVLLERTGPYTYSNILPRGIYDLIIAGGGGEGRSWNFGGVISIMLAGQEPRGRVSFIIRSNSP